MLRNVRPRLVEPSSVDEVYSQILLRNCKRRSSERLGPDQHSTRWTAPCQPHASRCRSRSTCRRWNSAKRKESAGDRSRWGRALAGPSASIAGNRRATSRRSCRGSHHIRKRWKSSIDCAARQSRTEARNGWPPHVNSTTQSIWQSPTIAAICRCGKQFINAGATSGSSSTGHNEPVPVESGYREHLAILQALVRRDSATASAAMLFHLRSAFCIRSDLGLD